MSLKRELVKYAKHPGRLIPRLVAKIMEPVNRDLAKLWVRLNGVDKLRSGRRVFLFGAFGGRRYGDNSAVLFEHMVEKHPEIECYWVIRKDVYAEHMRLNRIPCPEKVVFKGSFKANVLALIAEVHVYSHGHYDVTDYPKALLEKTRLVLLNHGVTALKKTTFKILPSGQTIAHIAATADLVIAGSEQEAKIKHEEWHVPAENIIVTGLPRHDRLLQLSREALPSPKKRVLFMPTWRDWNSRRLSLRETDFFRETKNFLVVSGLDDYMFEKGVQMDLYVHMWMREFFQDFKKEFQLKSVNLLPQTIDLQKIIVKSSILITDYSSICWDFLFLDKPVLFYQFDIEKYETYRGSYINIRKDLFGPICYDAKSASCYVQEFFDNKFRFDAYHDKMREFKKMFFAFNDGKNSDRVVNNIL